MRGASPRKGGDVTSTRKANGDLGDHNRHQQQQQGFFLRAKLSRWDRDMDLRKQAFGVDVFDVMQWNRTVGDRMGGVSDDPTVVEVFADAATDVEFLTGQRQERQSALAALDVEVATRNAAAEKEELSGTSVLLASTPSVGRTTLSTPWTFVSTIGTAMTSVFPTRNADEVSRRRLVSEIENYKTAILQRKELFGIELFDAMMSLGEDFSPRDARVCQLFLQAKKDMEVPMKKSKDAMLTIEQDAVAKSLSHEELREYVDTHPVIWAMLSVNCQIPEQHCKEVAFRVAVELITDHAGQESMSLELTRQGFLTFQKLYIDDAKGHQEFFHRTLFAVFDEDWNGVLDREEIDKFVDNAYVTGSIFQGDVQRPEKDDIKADVLEHLGKNGDCSFSFEEVRSLISGRMPTSQ